MRGTETQRAFLALVLAACMLGMALVALESISDQPSPVNLEENGAVRGLSEADLEARAETWSRKRVRVELARVVQASSWRFRDVLAFETGACYA